jgi:hypothetical protein
MVEGMVRVIFTLDYEIHGNGEGCPYELMVEPTARLLRLFEAYGAKLTIMADIAEILKFKQYAGQHGKDDYHYQDIAAQLQDAIRGGHDVQLHIHSSYFNATHDGRRWVQDWAEYNFAGLSLRRLDELIKLGKNFLESLLQPVNPAYRCNVFRAANWSVSPSRNVVRALVNNGIRIDTSVFKYGRRDGLVNFDYRHAHSALIPWRTDEDDICVASEHGQLFEFPIYCENRWLGAFVTPQRLFRAFVSWRHKFADEGDGAPARVPAGATPRTGRKQSRLARRHAWKADFNQCTGRQLIRALNRTEREYGRPATVLPFVLIGHSKLFTRFNEWDLRSFLHYVANRPERFRFGTFGDFELATLCLLTSGL